ncbi:MAG: Peptidase T [Firmicutes bacterium ADurb.Bin182]|nr:MAG: Peptidase T [Firmicutes bacterium ADurb.Bin182]
MPDAAERFLKYVTYDTQSRPDAEKIPSTDKQFALGELLVSELHEIGVSDARMDKNGYVYASIPANADNIKSIGFIAHLDTSPDMSGENVCPRIVKNFDGKPICLNDEVTLSPQEHPSLLNYVGQDIIVADGNTLLGADNKAGIAEIMAFAEKLVKSPEIKHGRICIGFTPDEEVGRGADKFDVGGFGADFAYTVDGGALGELEYENFNAAFAKIEFRGKGIHPGSAKNVMINACNVAMEFHAMLPCAERPEHTEGYEGFFHLTGMEGETESAKLRYIIRDHDKERFERKKELIESAAAFLNSRYGKGTVNVKMSDSYYNMKEKILPHMYIIDLASNAMRDAGIEPVVVPIRGGTDGARLSYMGLPCPNLCTGGHNFHGRYEYIPIPSMHKVCEILENIVKRSSLL